MSLFKKGFCFILAEKKYVPSNDIEYRSSVNKAEVKEQACSLGQKQEFTLSYSLTLRENLKELFYEVFLCKAAGLAEKSQFLNPHLNWHDSNNKCIDM